MAVTKADIVETICVTNGFSKKQSIETLETLLEIISPTFALFSS